MFSGVPFGLSTLAAKVTVDRTFRKWQCKSSASLAGTAGGVETLHHLRFGNRCQVTVASGWSIDADSDRFLRHGLVKFA